MRSTEKTLSCSNIIDLTIPQFEALHFQLSFIVHLFHKNLFVILDYWLGMTNKNMSYKETGYFNNICYALRHI